MSFAHDNCFVCAVGTAVCAWLTRTSGSSGRCLETDEELKASRSSLLHCSLMEQWAFLRFLLSPLVMLQIEMKCGSMAVTIDWPFC